MYITKELYMVKKILTSIGEKSYGAIRYFLAEVNMCDQACENIYIQILLNFSVFKL